MASGVVFAAKAARVSYNTIQLHLRNDCDFAAQVAEAEQQAADLLYAACFAAAIEGQIEPVLYQGEVVGHVRKFDSRLRIEMLRAHMPEKFKTPGAAPININNAQQILVMDDDTRHKIQAARREALQRMAG